MAVKIKANAKINLMLDILSRLDNGYHDLFMIMQSVSLADELTLDITDSGKIEITCSNPEIPTDERNIAHKAAEAFFAFIGINNPGLRINIVKRIPHAAGLGGGSADGAGVIQGLNRLFDAKLSEKDLITVGSRVGADVPFCALGGTMLGQYTGTVLSHLPDLQLGKCIIVKPQQNVSTAAAYAAFDTADRVRHLDRTAMLCAIMTGDNEKVLANVGNVFEQFIEVPDRVVIKSIMKKHGADCACMSGSGPSVFGLFRDSEKAVACLDDLKKEFSNAFLCDFCADGTEPIA